MGVRTGNDGTGPAGQGIGSVRAPRSSRERLSFDCYFSFALLQCVCFDLR